MSFHISADDMAAMADGQLEPARREHVEAHLADCADCRAELSDVLGLLDTASPVPASHPVKVVRRHSWSVAAGLAAAALLLAVLPPLQRELRGRVEPQEQRAASAAPSIVAITPAPDARLAREDLRFTWARDPGSTYRLVIVDSAGGQLFVHSTSDTSIALPATLPLASRARYFWYVDALRTDGSSLSTPASSFSVGIP